MLPQRRLGIDLQETMKEIIALAKNKGLKNYQLPIYLENMMKFQSVNFLYKRGITFEYVKKKIDEILTPEIYISIPKNLYLIDADNDSFKEILMWKSIMNRTIADIKTVLNEYPNYFYSSWY